MPFIMTPEGVGRLFTRELMADGPFPEHYEPFESPIDSNPMHAKPKSNPVARFTRATWKPSATPRTSVRRDHLPPDGALPLLDEVLEANAIVQPEQFVEIGEALAQEKGIKAGDRVKVRSNRGYIKAVAVVTKRIKALEVDGKPVHTIGIPIPLGFQGAAKPGFITNTLTPFVGDANTQTPEFKAFLVNVEKILGELLWHCNRWTSNSAPRPRRPRRRADGRRSPSSSTFPPASAARPARWRAWSGTTCATRSARHGIYDNPWISPRTRTVMRYAEVEEQGKLEWLIRKDGCMHCADPGCLKACPAPGAIIQYANGIVDFHQENCIGCGYCVTGCPFNVPRISKKDSKAYSARCVPTGSPSTRPRPAPRPARPAPSSSAARRT